MLSLIYRHPFKSPVHVQQAERARRVHEDRREHHGPNRNFGNDARGRRRSREARKPHARSGSDYDAGDCRRGHADSTHHVHRGCDGLRFDFNDLF